MTVESLGDFGVGQVEPFVVVVSVEAVLVDQVRDGRLVSLLLHSQQSRQELFVLLDGGQQHSPL